MKKFFIPIALLFLCTIICACTPKSNLDTKNPQIVTEITGKDINTGIEIEPIENQNRDIEDIQEHEKISEMPTCTADVKQCNDGSYVSRGGPNCEFSPCPGENLDNESNTNINETPGNEKLNTDEIVDVLTEYSKSGDFDEEGVDILYQIIDSLSE